MRSNGRICSLLASRKTPVRDLPELWEEFKQSKPTTEQLRYVEAHCRGRKGCKAEHDVILNAIIAQVDDEVELAKGRIVRSIPRDLQSDILVRRYRTSLGQVA